jgi:hypothetical protein
MRRKESFSRLLSTKLASTVTTRFWGAAPYDAALVVPGHLLCGSRRSERGIVLAPHSLRRAARNVQSSGFVPIAFLQLHCCGKLLSILVRRGVQCLPFSLVQASLALRISRCIGLGELPVNKSLKSDQRDVVMAFAKNAKATPTSFGALAKRYATRSEQDA